MRDPVSRCLCSALKLGVVLALAACGGSPLSAPAGEGVGSAPGPGTPADRVPLSSWDPLPPASTPSLEVMLAREQILGPNAIEPGKVKLWWVGVSSFVATGGGHLWLFDAWEPIGLQKDYVPIGRDELAALAPEAIFIGHGHFDHAADAGFIAGRSGAVVVGSDTICDTAKADAARDGNAANFTCLITGTEDTPPPGTVQMGKLWQDLPPVAVLQHIHSALAPQTFELGDTPFIHVPNLLPFLGYLNSDPQELLRFLTTLRDGQGGTWAYHLRFGDFSLFWHDSTGPITDAEPGGPEVRAALNALPECVDVQVGAIVGFDQPLSGLRDPRLYVEHAHPRLFLPTHHDAWAPVIGGGAAAYEAEWRAEMAALPHPPLLDYLHDPVDYLKPRIYDIADPIWAQPMPGSACAPAS